MRNTTKTSVWRIILHYALLTLIAPLIAVVTSGANERMRNDGVSNFDIEHSLRDIPPGLIVVALMLSLTVPLSATYQFLLQKSRLSNSSKTTLLASLIITFPFCCMAFAKVINYNLMYALAGGIMGIAITLPVVFHAWTDELNIAPASSPDIASHNKENVALREQLAEALKYVLAILLCLPASLEETKLGYGPREVFIDFLEGRFLIPLAVYLWAARSSKTGNLIRPKGFKLSSTFLIIGGLRFVGLCLVASFPKTK